MTNLTNYALCRAALVFIWFYQGLVPKLLGPHADELAMNRALGLSFADAEKMAQFAGLAEIAFAMVLLIYWRQRWPLLVSAAAMVALLGFVIFAQPSLLVAAFNPVIVNLAVFVLSVVGWRLHSKTHNGYL